MRCTGVDECRQVAVHFDDWRRCHAVNHLKLIKPDAERAGIRTRFAQALQALRDEPGDGCFAIGPGNANDAELF